MAEQAINTIYGLGDQPDALCSSILKEMTTRVFSPAPPTTPDAAPELEVDSDAMQVDDVVSPAPESTIEGETLQAARSASSSSLATDGQLASSFQLSQLIFVAGHCAIKQLVHLELVERDIKRRKAVEDKEKAAAGAGKTVAQDELDQVAGSVEDEIGDIIAGTKEHELLYGPQSLLAIFGPLAVKIVSQPKLFRVCYLFFRRNIC